MNELALFAGAGGGILGGKLLGWTTVCAVEINAFGAAVLLARQDDGHLPLFPVWDDVRTFNGVPWRGLVDVVSGGFPCQGISAANSDPQGLNDPRSGLWSEFKRVIREVGPIHVFVENSPMLTSRGLDVVLGDLASLGYDAEWCVLGACDTAWSEGDPIADHERYRIWIHAVSNTASERRSEAGELRRDESKEWSGWIRPSIPYANSNGCEQVEQSDGAGADRSGPASAIAECAHDSAWSTSWWKTEPGVHGVADGVADRVDRITAIGNGQVPAVVKLAWETLKP